MIEYIENCLLKLYSVPRTKAATKLDICPSPLKKRRMTNMVHEVEKTWAKVNIVWAAIVANRMGFRPYLEKEGKKYFILGPNASQN